MNLRFGLLLSALMALALPAMRPADADECCGQPAKSDAKVDAKVPEGKGDKPWMGRAKPQKQYDYGRFRAVVGSDGKTRYFPRLSKNVDTAKRAVALPESVDWSVKAPAVVKRMYLNDRFGCCVPTSRYHQLGFQTGADTGTGLEADDAEVYAAYQAACGRGDNGCDMSAMNVYQQKVGLKVKGTTHKSGGSVSLDHTNSDLVKTAILRLGGVNVGLALTDNWYQSADGSDWAPNNSRIVGGHEVQAFGYDAKGVWVSTWAGKRRILWAAFTSRQWVDETYATLTADWYGADGLAPGGIDVETLKADLEAIANGRVPPLPDPTPPGPTPPVPPGPSPPVPPGKGFTGVLVYKDGALTSVVPGGVAPTAVEEDLKAAGVSPAVIRDMLQLAADVKAKKGVSVIMADLMKLAADFTAEAGPAEKG